MVESTDGSLEINNLPTAIPLDCQVQVEQKEVHYFFLNPMLGREIIIFFRLFTKNDRHCSNA